MTVRITPVFVAGMAAIAVVTMVIDVATIRLRQSREVPVATSPRRNMADVDPMRDELTRCLMLGEAGAQDAGCLRAWSESRRRFLRRDARPPEPAAVQMFPTATAPPGSTARDTATDQSIPGNK